MAAYTFAYGAFSLRTSIKAGGHTLATYTYTNDRNNYLQALEYGNGNVVEYEYDTNGRVAKTHYYADDASTEPLETVTYQYDNNGALATVHDSATGITTTYYYDFIQRLMKYVESGNDYSHSVGYAYDEVNNLTSLVETINGTEHTTSYTYDEDNRVTMVQNGSTRRQYGYDSYGRTAGWISYFGATAVLAQQFTYKASGTQLTNQVATFNINSNDFTAAFRYTYDKNGNITSIRNGTTLVASYVYDSANQLIRENNQAAGLTWVWEYDNAGNILSRTEYPYTTAAEPSGGETVSYIYDDEDGWGDLLTGYNQTTIEYDDIGNPRKVKDANGNVLREYTWQNGRELASLSEGGTTWSYTYDANGMRTSRSDGTTTYEYVYNGSSLVQMTVGSSTLYFANGAVFYNGTPYYYVTNLQGDVIAILSPMGALVVQYTYDAWGNVLSTTGSMASTLGTLNPIRYRGYVYDQESGLYYLQSRYYDPEMGRFLNADALVSTGGLLGNNMFAYCGNNPVMGYDPGGYASCTWDGGFWGLERMAGIVDNGGGGYSSMLGPTYATGGGEAKKGLVEKVVDYIHNADEETVLEAEKVAFYKGALVIKADLSGVLNGTAASFGIIVMDTDFVYDQVGIQILNHEYGHYVHCKQIGLMSYASTVVIPSVTGAVLDHLGILPDDIYYSLPWEHIADHLGGVNRGGYTEWADRYAAAYWIYIIMTDVPG